MNRSVGFSKQRSVRLAKIGLRRSRVEMAVEKKASLAAEKFVLAVEKKAT